VVGLAGGVGWVLVWGVLVEGGVFVSAWWVLVWRDWGGGGEGRWGSGGVSCGGLVISWWVRWGVFSCCRFTCWWGFYYCGGGFGWGGGVVRRGGERGGGGGGWRFFDFAVIWWVCGLGGGGVGFGFVFVWLILCLRGEVFDGGGGGFLGLWGGRGGGG